MVSIVALDLILSVMLDQGISSFPEPATQTGQEQAPVRPAPSPAETRKLMQSGDFAELQQRFSAVQSAYENGTISDEELRAAFGVFHTATASSRPQYDAWVSAYPQSYAARLARGIYYEKVGESSRGGDYIANTSAKQIHRMDSAFDKASADLHASVELDAKPLLTYLYAMEIASYQGDGAQIRELLDLSIKADPGNFIVREAYMGTLEPRWGGSVQQMYDFLQESRQAGLTPVHIDHLESIIRADQAQTHWEAHEYADAERDYRAAISLGGAGCLKCLADVLIEDQKDEELIPVLTQILILEPGDVPSLQMRAHAYRRLGKMRQAIADFKAAAALGDPFAENELGRFNMTGVAGILPADPERAIGWFRKSAAQGNLAGSMELEKALKQLGRPAEPKESNR